MNISSIIKEVIDSYLNENIIINEDVFAEKAKQPKNDNASKDVVKKGKKLRKGLRTDFDAKKDRETNPNLNNQDAEDLNAILDSDYINLAAVAKDVYPDHTSQGAQSQLRKKVKGITNDNGSKYKLKKKEAFKIRRAIAKELP